MCTPGNETRTVVAGLRLLLALASLLVTALPAVAEDDVPSSSDFPRMSLDQDPKPTPPPAKEEPKLPWRTFELMTGVSYTSITSTVTMAPGGGNAALSIDAEGVLGLSREHLSVEIWTALRLGERHRLTFGFEDMTRTATRTLQRDIVVDGVTYSVGTSVHSVYGVQFYNLDYNWSFLQDDRIEMALSFGFDTLRAHFAIEATNTGVAENQRFIFPIPLPGVNGDFVLIPNLWLRERLSLMYVPIQNYAGLLVDFHLALEYSLLNNVSLGLGADLLRVELEKHATSSTWDDFEGDFRVNSTGILFYINFHW